MGVPWPVTCLVIEHGGFAWRWFFKVSGGMHALSLPLHGSMGVYTHAVTTLHMLAVVMVPVNFMSIRGMQLPRPCMPASPTACAFPLPKFSVVHRYQSTHTVVAHISSHPQFSRSGRPPCLLARVHARLPKVCLDDMKSIRNMHVAGA